MKLTCELGLCDDGCPGLVLCCDYSAAGAHHVSSLESDQLKESLSSMVMQASADIESEGTQLPVHIQLESLANLPISNHLQLVLLVSAGSMVSVLA